MHDSGPARHPLLRREIQWHHIESRQQHAVERAGGGDEVVAAGGAEHLGDHGVDRRRFDAHVVAAALLVGRRRAPIEQLLVAGRQRLLPAVIHHVEIEADAAALELRGVDAAYLGADAGELEVARKGQRQPFLVARGRQDLEGEGPAAGDMRERGAPEFVTGLREQREGAAQSGAVAAEPSVTGGAQAPSMMSARTTPG